MKNAGLAIAAFSLCAGLCAQRQAFIEAGYSMENKTYGASIGTVNCYVSGAPMSDPAIQLNGGDWLELHFDLLGPEYLDYTLVPIHCDAAWHPTDLEANEYIQGFTEMNITDFEDSFNTRVPYVHYTINFPNDLMKPRISGNYLLAVVHEGDGQQPVLTRRVVVYEQVCPLHVEAKLSSTVSNRYTHQEADARLNTMDFQLFNPSRDLHVTLLQNFDWQTARTGLRPQFIKTDEITFDLYEVNEFPAGNEWRWFETRDLNYISMHVDRIEQELTPEIEVYLRPDQMQGSKGYLSEPDINGRFLTECRQGGDDRIECEYHRVFFYLKSQEYPAATLSIIGNLQSVNPADHRMQYNRQTGCYEATLYLKQGYYNYRYLLTDPFHREGTLEYTEGNYSQAENDYCMIMYHHDYAVGYDRIIAFERDNSIR